MNSVLSRIEGLKIVPVIKINDSEHAKPLAEALLKGELPCGEITFRTDAAEKAIRVMAEFDRFLVGAGTVLTVENVKKAVNAGARFIVSPGLNPKVVTYCLDHDIPITPGVSTPSDIEKALDLGLTILKFFPAEAFGGLKTLKAISAPYGMARFIPTGGISAKNLGDYLQFTKVLACGGSWMVKPDDIDKGDFEKIAGLTREAVDIVKNIHRNA